MLPEQRFMLRGLGLTLLLVGVSMAPMTSLASDTPRAAKKAVKAEVVGERIVVSPGRVGFVGHSYKKLDRKSRKLVVAVAKLLIAQPELKRVRIEGHGAADGRPKY